MKDWVLDMKPGFRVHIGSAFGEMGLRQVDLDFSSHFAKFLAQFGRKEEEKPCLTCLKPVFG